jgi:hypothetical protein
MDRESSDSQKGIEMHSIASDRSTPANIRAAFARVTCQIVRHWSDGTESLINMISRDRAEQERAEHAKRIGRQFAPGLTLIGVTVRPI